MTDKEKSICKSKAYGETVEKTAEMHHVDADTVQKIWDSNPELINQYRNIFKEMGVE